MTFKEKIALIKETSKTASQSLTFKMVFLWLLFGLPLLTIYKLTGLVVMLHDKTADGYNKLDDWLFSMRRQ